MKRAAIAFTSLILVLAFIINIVDSRVEVLAEEGEEVDVVCEVETGVFEIVRGTAEAG